MYSKSISKYASIPYIVVGLIFLITGVLLLLYNNKFIKEANIYEGTIKNIDKYKIEAMYNKDNIENKIEYSAFINKGNVNDKINIYCKNNRCITMHSNDLSYVFIIVGSSIFIISLFGLITTLYKYKKYTNISSKGKIMAKITGVEVDEEELRDFVNPFYVICTGINPFTSKEENYRSENMWMDVRKIIEENNISELPVYIDENNNGNYRVDVTIIESKCVRSR